MRDALFRGHLISFTAVNAFLAFLNFMTASTHSHPWVLYVLGAWAIPMSLHGMIKHWRDKLQDTLGRWTATRWPPRASTHAGSAAHEASTPASAREHRPSARTAGTDAEVQGALPDHLFRPIRRLHRTMASFSVGAGTAGLVSAYLLLVDVLTGGGFWASIPIASMALVMLLWGLMIPGAKRRLRSQIEEAGKGEVFLEPGSPQDGEPSHPVVREAHHLRDRIVSLMSETVGGHDAMLEHVDGLVQEIERLAGLEMRFAEARRVLPLEDLQQERDQADARARALEKEGPDAQSLLHEYEATLRQLDGQMQSVSELARRHEVLELRLRSGVSALRQVSLDLVQYQGQQALGELDQRLTVKAEELSQQVRDLQESYSELMEELRG